MLLTAFALAALLLAAIGVYGVLSFAVTARTREMGIRIALGAERASVQRLVIGEGLALVAAGVVIGLAGAFAGARALRTFLFDLTPSDPVTYAAIIVVLGVAAVLAGWVPALRGERLNTVSGTLDLIDELEREGPIVNVAGLGDALQSGPPVTLRSTGSLALVIAPSTGFVWHGIKHDYSWHLVRRSDGQLEPKRKWTGRFLELRQYSGVPPVASVSDFA